MVKVDDGSTACADGFRDRPLRELSLREMACLQYLSGLMEATGEMIGEKIDPAAGRSARGNAMIGNKTARGLSIRYPDPPLTTWLSDLRAWRITKAGRGALSVLNNE